MLHQNPNEKPIQISNLRISLQNFNFVFDMSPLNFTEDQPPKYPICLQMTLASAASNPSIQM